MHLLDHFDRKNSGLKVVCEACGSFSIKAIHPMNASDGEEIRCGCCNALRGTMADLRELAKHDHLVLVCGRYEGVDQRVIDLAIDEEL